MNKRVEKNQLSLLALCDLLRDIVSNPHSYVNYASINNALHSQGALAKFVDESRGIHSSSINTQKRISENVLEDGYQTLNKLRLTAQLSIEQFNLSSQIPKKDTRAGLLAIIEQLKADKQSLKEEMLLLTMVLDRSLRQSERYASQANSAIQALCKKEHRELLDILSSRKYPLDTNVVKFP